MFHYCSESVLIEHLVTQCLAGLSADSKRTEINKLKRKYILEFEQYQVSFNKTLVCCARY